MMRRLAPLLTVLALLVASCASDATDESTTTVERDTGETTETTSPPTAETTAPEVTTTVPAVSFEGQTVTIFVGFEPGGGYDAYARLLADHIGRYLPGEPQVIVQNRPGLFVTENLLYNQDSADGSAASITSRALATAQLLDIDGVEFDASEFEWIGSMESSTYAIVVQGSLGVQTLDELQELETPPRAIPASLGTIDISQAAMPMLQVLGYEVNAPVGGQVQTADLLLAFERGELEIYALPYSTLVTQKPEWLENGTAVVVASVGACQVPSHPLLDEYASDVPCVTDPEVALELSGEDEAAAQFADVIRGFTLAGRPFALPPDTPPEVVDAWRAAFESALNDVELLSQAEGLSQQIDYISGAETAEAQDNILNASDEAVALLRARFLEEG